MRPLQFYLFGLKKRPEKIIPFSRHSSKENLIINTINIILKFIHN